MTNPILQNQTQMRQAIGMARLARQDPPKFDHRTGAEEEVRAIVVEVRPAMQVLPGGNLAYAGQENFFNVYESEAAQILAMVEDATLEDMAAVERHLAAALREWREQNPDLARDGVEPGHLHMYSSFRFVMGREMRPVIRAEILDQ